MIVPDRIKKLNLAELPLHFKDLPLRRLPIDPVFGEKLMKLSPRGLIALAAAMSEWVIWRIDKHHGFESEPLVEAIWVCSVHPSYLAPFQLEHWPKPSDPLWDSPPSKAFFSVQYHFRKIIEGMIGYDHFHDLSNWCYNVLETGMFKNKKNKFESSTGKEMAFTFHTWLHKTIDKMAVLSPIDQITSKCLMERNPSEKFQNSFCWGNAICRNEIYGEFDSQSNRTKTIDSLLKKALGNPYLCSAEELSLNKCWDFTKHSIPMLQGNPYTFAE
ncbi:MULTISPECIES: hypothetical protein [unclassified Allomuricauda]|uniref:hypothetical protein n=1 Tax=unclassified Allomuricauda TaxID=2615049 RepID=UPI00273F6BFC|nr:MULTISPECIES: hypothetical protein [unclassified Allomuricauda]